MNPLAIKHVLYLIVPVSLKLQDIAFLTEILSCVRLHQKICFLGFRLFPYTLTTSKCKPVV